jgi:hypothetical protein
VIATWPLAARLTNALSSTSWVLVAVAPDRVEAFGADLKEQLESLLDDMPVEFVAAASPRALLDLVQRHPKAVLVISGLDALDAEAWRQVDANRSRLARELLAVLLLEESGLQRVVEHAPNLWSWLGGSVWYGILEGDEAHALDG